MRALLLAGVVAVGWAGVAHSAVYDLTFKDSSNVTQVVASITVSNTLDSKGGYDVLGVSGQAFGAQITALVINPSQPTTTTFNLPGFHYTYDNVFFNTDVPFNNDGLLFQTGATYVNLYNNSSNSGIATALVRYSDNSSIRPAGTFTTVTDVPEPASLALLGAGVVGASMIRRRRAAVAA